MEMQLRELIEQIKKDGVTAAETEAKEIVDAAKAEAEKIVADARKQADGILANAKAENERMTKSSEEAIRQAGRNLLISFRESVTRELNAIMKQGVSEVYSSDALAQMIVNSVAAWTKNPEAEDISVILNTEALERLEKTLLAALKEKMGKGLTLKANDSFDGGFRIAVNNGTAYYDYSTEAVVEMLSAYMDPKTAALLKEA